MRKLFRLFVVAVLLGGWVLAAAALHVVRTDGSIPWLGAIKFVGKDCLSFKNIYTDVRGWTDSDLAAHPVLMSRLQAAGRQDVLSRIPAASPATQPAAVSSR